MDVSIIIPTLNEAENLRRLIPYLRHNLPKNTSVEFIIADGGSNDGTTEIAYNHPVDLIRVNIQSRACQINEGAKKAKGNTLYFLHADTFPPSNFIQLIQKALDSDFKAGSFRLSFDMDHWFLKAFAWFTRFNITAFRFGDQSLFITAEAFQSIGGFNEELSVMEDQEIIYRVKKQVPFIVLQEAVISSARKYRENGIYYQQGLYIIAFLAYYIGVDPKRLMRWVNKLS